MERRRRSRRPSGDDREKAILATAEQLLETRTIRDVSIDDLARGAGISRPTFYFYFSSKEAVILTLLDRVAEEAGQVRGAALAEAGDDVAALWRRGLETIVETFVGHRALVLAVSQMMPDSAELRQLWSLILAGFVDDVELGIRSEQQRGAAPGGIDARHLAVALIAMTERLVHSVLAGEEPTLGTVDPLEVVLAIWSRAIYADDHLGGRPGATGPPASG